MDNIYLEGRIRIRFFSFFWRVGSGNSQTFNSILTVDGGACKAWLTTHGDRGGCARPAQPAGNEYVGSSILLTHLVEGASLQRKESRTESNALVIVRLKSNKFVKIEKKEEKRKKKRRKKLFFSRFHCRSNCSLEGYLREFVCTALIVSITHSTRNLN